MFMREGRSKFWDKMQINHIFKTCNAGDNRKSSSTTWKSSSSSHRLIIEYLLIQLCQWKDSRKQETCGDWSFTRNCIRREGGIHLGGTNDVRKMAEVRRDATLTAELLSRRRGERFLLVGEQLGGAGLFPLNQHGMTEVNISSLLWFWSTAQLEYCLLGHAVNTFMSWETWFCQLKHSLLCRLWTKNQVTVIAYSLPKLCNE